MDAANAWSQRNWESMDHSKKRRMSAIFELALHDMTSVSWSWGFTVTAKALGSLEAAASQVSRMPLAIQVVLCMEESLPQNATSSRSLGRSMAAGGRPHNETYR
jgi:hypothetical protein